MAAKLGRPPDCVGFLYYHGLLGMLLLLGWVAMAAGKALEERPLQQTRILDVELPVSLDDFVRVFWDDDKLYKEYLTRTGDVDIEIAPWRRLHDVSAGSARERTVVSHHPVNSPVAGMGLPKFAKSTKRQTLQQLKSADGAAMVVVHEVNEVSGVPFADKFYVVVTWTARWPGGKKGPMHLQAVQQVILKQSFWLSGVVEKSSASETRETMQLWVDLARQQLDQHGQNTHVRPAASCGVPVAGVATDGLSTVSSLSTPSSAVNRVLTMLRSIHVNTSGAVLLTGLLTTVLVMRVKPKHV